MSVISPLTKEKAAPELRETYDKLTGAFGRMPNIFGIMAYRPAALKSFLELYGAVINEGKLEAKYKELAYLETAIVNGCEYCTRAHTASSKRIGLSEQQIKALPFYQRSHLFDEKEKAALLYAERVTRGAAAMREGTVEELRKHFSDDQIVELTFTICVANFTNRFNDALQITPDLG